MAERVVDAVLALPQVVVIHPADTDEGRTQIERVARTLLDEQNGGLLRWHQESDELRRYYLEHARAAIDALKGERDD